MIITIFVFTFVRHAGHRVAVCCRRVIAIPVIAGLAYEALRLGARFPDSLVMRALMAPGIWLQRITTQEPDASQIDVAVASFREVLRREAEGAGTRLASAERATPSRSLHPGAGAPKMGAQLQTPREVPACPATSTSHCSPAPNRSASAVSSPSARVASIQDQVREFLGRVADQVEVLEKESRELRMATGSKQATGAAPGRRGEDAGRLIRTTPISKRFAALLENADREATSVIAEAKIEAARILSRRAPRPTGSTSTRRPVPRRRGSRPARRWRRPTRRPSGSSAGSRSAASR